MECIEVISHDHELIRQGLEVLEGMVDKLESGERIELADVAATLEFLKQFGDEYHQRLEETVLFPALLAHAPHDSSLRQVFREHSEERAAVAEIEAALNPKRGKAFVRSTRQLVLLLRTHVDKEDNILKELAERSLSKEEDSKIAAEFIKKRTHATKVATLTRLENRYGTRSERMRILDARPITSPARVGQ